MQHINRNNKFILHRCVFCALTKSWQRGCEDCMCRCAPISRAMHASGYTHTHMHTLWLQAAQALVGLPGPIQTLWSPLIWERPWLWGICSCKYDSFPLTKPHHMSEPQGLASSRAQVAFHSGFSIIASSQFQSRTKTNRASRKINTQCVCCLMHLFHLWSCRSTRVSPGGDTVTSPQKVKPPRSPSDPPQIMVISQITVNL